jgi:HPt (histidine-containing phosphotransfer) domain-containing protein
MSKLHKKLPRLNFKHVLWKFPDELEKNYYEDFFRISLPIVRVAIILAIALYALFGILDIWIVPVSKNLVWFIRYALVCPVLIVTLIFTFSGYFKKYMQAVLSVIGFILGFGIVMMIGFTVESELGFKFYYAGLMLVLMWVYALARIRFVYATAVSWLITFSYEIVAIFINKMLGSSDNFMVFINNNFFFISANVIGMFASFTIEWYMRKNFLLRMEIEKSYSLNQKYMDNIKEGLLLIDEKYTILNQYSEFLTRMFENRELADIHFVDFIYPDKAESAHDRAELEKFLDFLFHNKSADIDMIMDINPFKNKKIQIRTNEFISKEIIVNADFIRLLDRDTVEYLMVIFEDITDIVKYEKQLQDQKTKYLQEVESISAILKSGPEIFSNFLEESGSTLNEIKSGIYSLSDPEKLNRVFRQVHSLKGSAKHLELNYMSTVSHQIEDILANARDHPERMIKKSTEELENLIAELFNEFQNLSKMIERFKMFSNLRDIGIKTDKARGPLQDFLNSLPNMVDLLAHNFEKHVKLEVENSLANIPFLAKIKNPIIHLLRNSVDHGIEDQFERLSRNKNATGKIVLRLSNSGSFYLIEVEDDGSGIDFEKIRKKAVEKKLIGEGNAAPAKERLIQLIFKPSFSSRDVVTEISGRGYGLDIVKDAAETLQGKIRVQTKKGEGTKITMTIPR